MNNFIEQLKSNSSLINRDLPNDNIYCKCGCNQKTSLITKNNFKKGYIKGGHFKYIKWHNPNPRKGKTKYSDKIILKKLCACGCRNEINAFDKRGRERFYKDKHYFKINKHNTKILELDEQQKQILIGSLLGDGSLSYSKNSNCYMYSEEHCPKQKDYLLWKNKVFRFNINEEEKEIYKTNRVFKYYRELFYPNGKKIITREILDKLEPLGLAVWFMDDGFYNYRLNNLSISTHCFGLEGNQIIQQYFKEKWDIDSKIIKIAKEKGYTAYLNGREIKSLRDNYYIKFNVEDAKKFIRVIKSHILQIPSMHYKIGLDEEKQEQATIMNKEYKKRAWTKEKEKRLALKINYSNNFLDNPTTMYEIVDKKDITNILCGKL